jgi:enolase
LAYGSEIIAVNARQIYSDRGHPGVEATVKTRNGGKGVAVCTAGVSVGTHEVEFAYDGGEKWRGRGVMKAVDNIINIIGPAIIGMDASKQREVDNVMLNIGGKDAKTRLGGNAIAAVSAAVLKAGAASLDVPLYQHIGGVNACILPVPGVLSLTGSTRYGGNSKRSGGKPSYSFIAYGFDNFSDASYACWELSMDFFDAIQRKFNVETARDRLMIGPGIVKHDKEIWDVMVDTIDKAGYTGKVGIQVDCAAATYLNKETGKFEGLFSAEPKSREDLIEFYHWMVDNYPFVILEDPLDEDDYDGHAILTRDLGIQIVGDDLFTTNPERVKYGIEHGAANCVLLKVNQIGSITEAFDMVQLAYRNGYGVMPCSSRGEGSDIADYTVGLHCGHLRESGVGPTGNRFLEIEAELGSAAKFLGREALKISRTDR